MEVFSHPARFSPVRLPPFYAALLKAWTALEGSCSLAGLVVGSFSAGRIPVASLTCKSAYHNHNLLFQPTVFLLLHLLELFQ